MTRVRHIPHSALRTPRFRQRGISIVELLIAMAISAMLLTATMVALDASFQAYAVAAESASAQTATRMVTTRLMQLLRTSTAHGPLKAEAGTPAVTLSGNTVTSWYIELIDADDNDLRIEYRAATDELWLVTTPSGSSTPQEQPLLGGVIDCKFFALRRRNNQGLLVLERATMDLTVDPGVDATLGLEAGNSDNIRVIASTMPRKIE